MASPTLFQAEPSGVRPPDGSFRRFDLGRGWIDANEAALPSMHDVAREAGVCVWTAYEAFRTGGDREPRISAKAANAVMDAAERLGYVPKRQVGEYERMVLEQAARGGRNG